MRSEEGHAIIKDIVNQWSNVYINQVFFDADRSVDNVLA